MKFKLRIFGKANPILKYGGDDYMDTEMTSSQAAERYLTNKGKYFHWGHQGNIRKQLNEMSVEEIAMLNKVQLEMVVDSKIKSILLGILGIDRFLEGQYVLGALKIACSVLFWFVLPMILNMFVFMIRVDMEINEDLDRMAQSYRTMGAEFDKAEHKESLKPDFSLGEWISASSEWRKEEGEDTAYNISVVICGILAICFYIWDGKNIVVAIQQRNMYRVTEYFNKVSKGEVTISDKAVKDFLHNY